MLKILGLASCLPGDPITNFDLERCFGVSAGWLNKMTGNNTRYYCAKLDGGSALSLLDIAEEAASKALKSAQVKPESIGFVILSTATPDNLMPATVHMLLDRLGLNGIPAFQIQGGCTGALQAFYLADQLAGNLNCRGLVVGADSCQKFWSFGTKAQDLQPQELVNMAMFGDGAGAAVVSAQGADSGLRIEHILCRTEGLGRKPGQIARWFGASGAPLVAAPGGAMRSQAATEEDYKAIALEVPRLSLQVLRELMAKSRHTPEDYEYFLGPQLNYVMSEKIAETLAFPAAKRIHCVQDTGNNGNALPFMQLENLAQTMKAGQSALQIAIESSKWIVTGMHISCERAL